MSPIASVHFRDMQIPCPDLLAEGLNGFRPGQRLLDIEIRFGFSLTLPFLAAYIAKLISYPEMFSLA